MPEFASIRSYRIFEDAVKTKTRFARDAMSSQFLATLVETIQPSRAKRIPTGTAFFRARSGCVDGTEVINAAEKVEVEAKFPHPANELVPTARHARDGRVNVQGIPCLYLATTSSAAIAEMRPWLGSYITLARFKATRKLRVVDCCVDRVRSFLMEPLDGTEPDSASKEKGVWGDVGHAFSKPVTYDEPHLDYVPTQILSEVFRDQGFDGVAYRSLLDKKGKNIALFDLSAAHITETCLYRVERAALESAKIESEQSPSAWPESISSDLRLNDRFIDPDELESAV